jgi:hypothetical protein
MKNNSNIDRLTKDILKNSYLEVADPDFDKTIMKKVLRESRKQCILQNFLMCTLVFAFVDTIILFVIWFFRLDVFNIALWPGKISHELLLHIGKIRDSILQNGFTKYIVVWLIVIAIADLIIESKFKLLERHK